MTGKCLCEARWMRHFLFFASVWGTVTCLAVVIQAAEPEAAKTSDTIKPADAAKSAPEKKLPTLWIIGDSTVRNGQDTGSNGQWGWGNPIASFFDKTKINVQNRALGGTSSRTFRTNPKLWKPLLAEMQSGDFLIMQFGHNDGGAVNDASRARGTLRGNGEETQEIDNLLTGEHEIVHTYGWYIRQFIDEAKKKGAAPIVCSPIPRNNRTGGKINRNTDYNSWAEAAAKQGGAPFINLNEIIAKHYDAEGQPKVQEYFTSADATHTSWTGAVLNALCVIEGLKGLDKCELTGYLLAEPPKDLKPPAPAAK
jgi:rhamnogalacturonan acetylesterase